MTGMETSNLTKSTLIKMFQEGKRFDGRKLLDYRPINITTEVSNKAEGSARVTLGKTDVVVGVKFDVGTPYPDSPGKGNLSVSADLLPMASPRFEMGPPDFEGIELPRLVDRALRHAGLIDLTKLVIKEGEKVWTMNIDVYPINDDGNLIDAAVIGALAALKSASLPHIDEKGKIDYHTKSNKKAPIDVNIVPISISFFKLGNTIILDPTREEEEACDCRITFGVSNWDNQIIITSCQKKGEAILTSEETGKMMDIISEKYDELNKKLKKLL